MCRCAQREAEQGPPEGRPGIAAKRLVGRKLVRVLLGRGRGDKVDALAGIGRRDVGHPAAVGVKDDQRVPYMGKACLCFL